MQPARLPPDEGQRLEALRQTRVLDTDPERAFDQLTALAAQICEAPVALISLVDEDRQWFKSRVGLSATETARDIAFCAHAILGPDLMIVPDASEDERFHDNPLVASDPSIRFYAGSPLRTHDGHALGTLCVIDTVPRQLRTHQEQALRTLARHTVAQLELRRAMGLLLDHLNRSLPTEQARVLTKDAFRPLAAALQVAIEERDQAEQAVRDLEQQFRRLEAFERIGRLASGLAHDVNNLLTVVLGHSELLLGQAAPDLAQRESMQAIREAADLASQLMRRVLSAGRDQPATPQRLDLEQLLQRTGGILRFVVPERIEVRIDTPAAGAWVEADPIQLEQVIFNLAVNASDAMPAGGTLSISTEVRELSPADHERLGTSAAGPHAVLTVADTGVGMDPQTLALATEPFFTTKSTGTGLGLASVHEIVRSLGGALSLTSHQGQGTSVEVLLPLSPRP